MERGTSLGRSRNRNKPEWTKKEDLNEMDGQHRPSETFRYICFKCIIGNSGMVWGKRVGSGIM